MRDKRVSRADRLRRNRFRGGVRETTSGAVSSQPPGTSTRCSSSSAIADLADRLAEHSVVCRERGQAPPRTRGWAGPQLGRSRGPEI